ncbi:MAG TPA: hypothetical protein VK034_09705 [Enhygromyxa sp.]|nr:hypothetical protein [Enhygromyxa sp.]
MKTVGIILLVLGLAGLGGGVYGMTQEQAARDTIAQKQNLLREAAPTIETELGLKLDDIADLVAIDRAIKDNVMLPDDVRNAAWDILNAMGDEEDMAKVKLGGFAGGGGLLVIGLLLFVLGARKQAQA